MTAMFALGITSTPYKILLLIHVLGAITSFGLAMAYYTLAKTNPEGLKRTHNRIVLPALIITWFTGNGVVGLSEKYYTNEQTWVILSQIFWLAAAAVALVPLRSAIAKLVADNSESNRKRIAMMIGMFHLCLSALVILMVFKFGGPT